MQSATQLSLHDTKFRVALEKFQTKWPECGYRSSGKRFTEAFRFFAKYYSSGKILDIGGWPGNFSCVLASIGYPVEVVDKDASRPLQILTDAKPLEGTLNGIRGDLSLAELCAMYGVTTKNSDLESDKLPYPDNSVDFILFMEVIEHLHRNPLHAVREIRRVLKPGGHVMVTTPNLISLQNRIAFLFGKGNYDGLPFPYDALINEELRGHAGHFRVFSMRELENLFEKCGFEILAREYKHIKVTPPKLKVGAMRKYLEYRLSKIYPRFGNTLFLVARPKKDGTDG